MATSNVIIVNLWEHQVGLYQGANMGLLKTVFEVNLQLFQAARGWVCLLASNADYQYHIFSFIILNFNYQNSFILSF